MSSLRPRVSSLNSEHPSPESVMPGTASTLRRSVSCWNSEHPSSDYHRKSTEPSGPFLFFFVAAAGALLVLSSLRPRVSSLNSERPSPQSVMPATASTLRRSVSCWNSEPPSPACHRKSTEPSGLFSFFVLAAAGALLVLSSLRPRVLSLNSERSSPKRILVEQRAPIA